MHDMTSRRRRAPLEDDDLLWEILLRLPPQPSSLPRASAVCKRWQHIATDPKFVAGFRDHHRKPPLLGVFHCSNERITFTSILDAPDRIPTQRFDLRRYGGYNLLGCRHGHVLAMDWCQTEIMVCDPVTGEHRRVAVPQEVRMSLIHGTVLCPAAGDQGHVHGGGCPFKVVLMTTSVHAEDFGAMASVVYSSETGVWGDLVKAAPTTTTYEIDFHTPPALVASALYWLQLFVTDDILVFDTDKQDLALVGGPPVTNEFRHGCGRITQAEEEQYLVLAVLFYPRFQMWHRDVNSRGVATWVLQKTVDMHDLLGLPPTVVVRMIHLLGCSEDADTFFIFLEGYVHMVQLKSMQSKRLHETEYINNCYAFTSFYTPGEERAATVVSCD